MGTVVTQYHVMVKPTGPICNLDCKYCYYLSKKSILGNDGNWQISDRVLEKFIRQYISSQNVQEVNFSWQGGEPTLLGIGFFEKVIKLQKKYCPPIKRISNDLQTNGTLLDDEWCKFLHDNRFLVGLSIDGPSHLHDYYRVDKKQQSTFEKVVAAAELMKKYRVEFNTLTVVNRTNARKPMEVYRFLRDELKSEYMQFIPCVEPKEFATVAPQYWDKDKQPVLNSSAAFPTSDNSVVTDWSVDADDYGRFLCMIFDEWLKNDVGKVFVRLFDTALTIWLGMPSSDCCFAEICGKGLALEHDGNLYSCDHYVYPEYRLGNIAEKTLFGMVYSEKQARFGLNKTDTLTRYCKDCEVRFACNGGCPKDRFLLTPDGEFGLSYLCKAHRRFFNHIDPWMKLMAKEVRSGRTADNVMKVANKSAYTTRTHPVARRRTKLNAPCPCGSGRKYKKCCLAKDSQQADKKTQTLSR
jgi:uncharacterized protein